MEKQERKFSEHSLSSHTHILIHTRTYAGERREKRKKRGEQDDGQEEDGGCCNFCFTHFVFFFRFLLWGAILIREPRSDIRSAEHQIGQVGRVEGSTTAGQHGVH